MLIRMVEKKASDLFVTAGVAPCIKVNGRLQPVDDTPLTPERTRELVLSIMNENQRKEFVRSQECNFAISARGVGRFRVSAFYQRNLAGMVLRRIESRIPSTEELLLPPIINDLAMTKRGLIIFVGATGTGKSTSLAAMIGHRNRNSSGHIITIEDPIEFVHQHQKCIVTQREVGIDTESFDIALKNTLRQAPDVILIGEIRARETMQHAITFAETGHLCLATLHANNANQALDRIQNFFPADARDQLWMDLSLNLKATIAQQLIPTVDGQGRRAAIEVLINTPLVSDIIRKGEVHSLKELMERSGEQGMQTFDQALYQLYMDGQISYEHALAYADSQNNVRLMIKMGTHSGGMGRAASLTIDGEAEKPAQFFGKR
ncbi:MAG: PilT/PilU family type 4a pilus ATPase [Gammaproteobacteria bacterium]